MTSSFAPSSNLHPLAEHWRETRALCGPCILHGIHRPALFVALGDPPAEDLLCAQHGWEWEYAHRLLSPSPAAR